MWLGAVSVVKLAVRSVQCMQPAWLTAAKLATTKPVCLCRSDLYTTLHTQAARPSRMQGGSSGNGSASQQSSADATGAAQVPMRAGVGCTGTIHMCIDLVYNQSFAALRFMLHKHPQVLIQACTYAPLWATPFTTPDTWARSAPWLRGSVCMCTDCVQALGGAAQVHGVHVA